MVQGITISASILLLAAIGIAIGLGLYFLAAAVAIIGFIALGGTSWADAFRKRYGQEEAEKIFSEDK